MSNSDHDNDRDRYFNDPEYRRRNQRQDEENTADGSSGSGFLNLSRDTQGAIFWGGCSLGVILLLGIAFLIYLVQGLPSVEQLENPQTAVASVVKSRDGKKIDRFYTQNRTFVPIDQISDHAINALIATEDHRFYQHWGIDMRGIFAAIYQIFTTGDVRGASTISQQLARNLYKKIGREFSLTRKFREMITAVEIEHNYTKREILEMYLNTVQFPNSAFGIQAAALTHYGKNAKDLTVSEAATLIGSLKAIYYNNPRINPEHAKERRNTVLYLLQKRGFISAAVYNKLRKKPIALDYHPPSKSGRESRYFGQYVKQKVMDWTKKNGYNLYTDGLTIYTTIDSRLQMHAKEALNNKLDSLQKIYEKQWTSSGGEYMNRLWKKYPHFLDSFIRETDRYKNAFSKYDTKKEAVVFDSLYKNKGFIDSVKHGRTKLNAGFVSIDPKNGHILAWVGGKNYGNVQYDHVYQSKRQTGSTFKPIVYTVAIDNGYEPYTKFSKYPKVFYDRSGKKWDPRDPHIPKGPKMVPLRQGLARSLNNVTVGLLPALAGAPNTSKLEDLQPAARKIKQMAMNMGIDMSKEKAYPSIALGTAKASLLEMVSAYTTFANEGVHIDPIAVTRIEDKQGNVIKRYEPDYRQEVISPETAYTMIDMMRGVIRGGKNYYGTGIRLRTTYNVTQDIAGKTGTTQNAADNWFIGVTPHNVMGAWVGGEDRRIRFPTWSRTGQGAHTALPIVGDFIAHVKKDSKAPWSYDGFKKPPGFVMPQAPSETNSNSSGDDHERIGW